MSIIFFDRPAALFEEALPLGNGKLGVKVNIKWKNGKITYYEIKGGRPCKVIKCR